MIMQQDEFGIYDIYTFIHTPFWQKMWFKGMLLFLAVMIVSFFIGWLMNVLVFAKKNKSVPVKQLVLQKLERIRQTYAIEDIQKLYTDLGLILRLFFTDTHESDMISLTEHEMIQHVTDCVLCNDHGKTGYVHHCVVCANNVLSLSNWHEEVKQLLEHMSNVKYKADIPMRNESVINDINIVTILVHSVYFKK